MTIYYSAETIGFYDSAVHKTMPSDVVEITHERRNELLELNAEGKTITSDSEGFPIVETN